MTCKIGITTDLDRRRQEWELEYPDLSGWQMIDGPFETREEAQEAEDRLAEEHGCESHHGGGEANGPWWVYKFYY